ncbi:fibronectin type III domain-containing protein [Marixanthomonas ophiurae]|uniref:T9SS C-terminal target domain-containing protein n=1 Tax=Marixanthomonas ophiurae TaxID=387659 RepID=A0A3E1Q8W0_9FLAO|nr:fibronectin type III domain-containing protein [Marixanthomonas ophiurae]RFN58573.1 T9SS C-terminal target domain-containing protein [Marixanthomonas ophiurae]
MKNNTVLTFVIVLILTTWQSSAQFLESFDTEIPRDWTIDDNDGQGGTWQHQTAHSYRGVGGVRINYEDNPHDDYLISPQFTVNTGISDQVSFYAGGTGATFPETFDVKLSTTGTRPSDFTVVLGSEITIADVDDLGQYINYSYSLASYTGQDVYVAIVATSPPAFQLYVDEFSVTALPSCPKPSNITAANISASSVDVSWNEGQDETEWTVTYGEIGFDPERDGQTLVVSGTPAATLINLTPNTTYDIYVRAICAWGTDESEQAGPLQVQTPCMPARTPFNEGFESGYADGNQLDGCWSQELISNTYWKTNSSITNDDRAPRTGDWNIYLTYGSETWMYYPVSVQTDVNYTFTLYARQSNSAGAEISVKYGTSNTASAMTEEIVPVTQITSGDYQEVTNSFTATRSETIYIGVKGKINSGFFPFYMSVDDISFTETTSCFKPIDLITDATTATTADVSWSPVGAETEWMLKYGEPGFDPETEGTSLQVNSNPNGTITDLIPAHIYNVYVQAQCGGSDGNSAFTGPLTVKTRPVNDNICDAAPLIVDEGCTTGSFTNVGATLEANEPQGSCFEAAGDQTVWFTFEAPPSGNITVTTDFEGGTLSDNELAIYTAPGDCNDFTTMGEEIGCDEDGGTTGTGFLSTVTLTDLIPGVTYYAQVNGFVSFGDGTFEGTFCIEVQDDGPSCAAPTDVVVNDITPNSATVSWTPGDREPEWEILYGPTGFNPTTGGTFVIDNDGTLGETLTSLEANITYDVYVRAICNPIDESFLSEVVTFTTVVAPPVNDDVCNALSLIVDQTCNGNSYANIGATAQRDETQGACLNPIPNATVWFTFTAPASGNVTVTTNIGASDLEDTQMTVYEAPSDCTNLTTMGAEIGCNDDVDAGNGEYLSTVQLTALTAGETYYVQINGYNGEEGNFCIEVRDDGMACPAPSNIEVANVTTTTADVSWRVNGTETEWEVRYGSIGFNPTTEGFFKIDTDGDPGITIDNLNANTEYDVYVRALCSSDTESVFEGPIPFTTMELTVASNSFTSFSFYPNPIENELTLSAQESIDQVVIYNLLGQVMKEATPNASHMTMHMATLRPGVYLMEVTLDGSKKSFRLLKE